MTIFRRIAGWVAVNQVGKMMGVFNIFHNEELVAAQSLSRFQEQALSESAACLMLVDANGAITFTNKAFVALIKQYQQPFQLALPSIDYENLAGLPMSSFFASIVYILDNQVSEQGRKKRVGRELVWRLVCQNGSCKCSKCF